MSLTSLYIDNNRMSGVIPNLQNRNISVLKMGRDFLISGTIPDVSALSSLTRLELQWTR